MLAVPSGERVEEENPYRDIIVPPPAYRSIIDKTAEFVAKNGAEYERRMLAEPNAAERFGFLLPAHGYRAYYERKLEECRTGQVREIRPVVPEVVKELWAKEERNKNRRLMLQNRSANSAVDEQFTALDLSGGGTEGALGQFSDLYTVSKPMISALEEDVIKLVARFGAVNGGGFVNSLMQRERGNPQFDFLKSSHPLHPYFQCLTKAYTRLVDLVLRNKDVDDEYVELLRYIGGRGEAVLREIAAKQWLKAAHTRKLREEKRQREEAEESERAAMEAIAWDRFVVVETIVFGEADKHLPLPAPDWNPRTVAIVREKPAPAPAPEEVPAAAPSVAPAAAPKPQMPKRPPAAMIEVAVERTDEDEEKVVVKTDYVRKSKRASAGPKYFKCPITGQLVLAEEMTSHLKVLLLDKQWKTQRDELLARALADSAYAPDNDIETNITNFVLKRPDLFGSVEDEVHEHAEAKRSRLG